MAAGDILLDRGVARQMASRGMAYPLSGVASLTARCDVGFANLECPLALRATKLIKRFAFKARPSAVAALRGSGLTVLSVANNHSLDCGRAGLLETLSTLRSNGIAPVGAGNTRADAETPLIITRGGIKIAFVAFCQFVPEGVALLDDRPGLAMADETSVVRAVANARRQANVVVASFHWGVEYSSRPREIQLHLARLAVQSGADLVLGHHPHVLQGMQVLKVNGHRGLIAYSLGNFVFDHPTAGSSGGTSNDTMILRCRLSKHGVTEATIIAAHINNCRPEPATPDQAAAILGRLTRLSAELNTTIIGNRVIL